MIPFYPFLFVTYIALSFYAHNVDHGGGVLAISTIVVLLAISALAFFLFGKDRHKAALKLFVIQIIFFTYGHIHGFLSKWYAQEFTFRVGLRITNYAATFDFALTILLLLISGLIMFLAWRKIKKLNKDLTGITQFFNRLTSILLVLALFILVQGLFFASGKRRVEGKIFLRKPKVARDIYFIVLDGYGRDDVLKQYYQHDNSSFTNFLKDHGFQHIPKGRSNYNWTFLSLPSTLNMEYIHYLKDEVGVDSQDLRIPFEMIVNNRVSQLLRSIDYRYVHFNSTWGATAKNSYADQEIGHSQGLFTNEFLRVFAKSTMLKAIDFLFVDDLAQTYHYTFQKLANGAKIAGPKFVFAHILIPHYPYIFDRDGNVVNKLSKFNQFKGSMWDKSQAYVEQLLFVNMKMKEVVDTLLTQSDVKPIIIIQSDHGPQVKKIKKSHPQDFRDARLANYNAILLPDGPILPKDLTPVNSFRYIFNHYFGGNFELLENKTSFTPFNKPYSFTN